MSIRQLKILLNIMIAVTVWLIFLAILDGSEGAVIYLIEVISAPLFMIGD